MQIQRDSKGAPILLKVRPRLHNLERMLEHKQRQLDSGSVSEGTAKWYHEEIEALELSIAALTYHQAVLEGLPQFVSALRAVVDAQGDTPALKAAAKRAALVLQEYDRQRLPAAG